MTNCKEKNHTSFYSLTSKTEADSPKILVVDDNQMIRKTLERILSKENYYFRMAKDGEDALFKISQWIPDLILLDVRMPKMDGLEVCRRLKNNHKYNFIYIIMLTAKSSTTDEVIGLDIGADDYVAKPFNVPSLLARIRRGLRLVQEKLDATFDPLTRLYNRRIFELFLQQETAKFRRYHQALSLIFIDLDHFKAVNDNFGHQAGDEVLQELGRLLREETRETDLPARWGGEELAILLPNTNQAGAYAMAESLRRKLEKHEFPGIGRVTASFGVAEMSAPHTDLVKTADNALYQAKQTGRNNVRRGQPVF